MHVSKSQCFFSNLKYNYSNLWDMRNLQEQVKKLFCYQKLIRPLTAWINFSSDHKKFANSWPSASKFKSFSRSVEHFFLTVGQNNFCSKIPMLLTFFLITNRHDDLVWSFVTIIIKRASYTYFLFIFAFGLINRFLQPFTTFFFLE